MDADSSLVVIAYPDESRAQGVRERLDVLGQENLITMQVIAILSKDKTGAFKIQRPGSRIMHPFSRSRDTMKIEDQVLLDAARQLEPEGTALCLLVQSVTPERVIPELSKYGGAVIKTSLPKEREDLLREAFAQQMTAEQIAARLSADGS